MPPVARPAISRSRQQIVRGHLQAPALLHPLPTRGFPHLQKDVEDICSALLGLSWGEGHLDSDLQGRGLALALALALVGSVGAGPGVWDGVLSYAHVEPPFARPCSKCWGWLP